MTTSEDLQNILDFRNVYPVASILEKPHVLDQRELNSALAHAIEKESIHVVQILLQRGARLTDFAFIRAIRRADTALFTLFMDHGWDLDSTKFESTAVAMSVSRPDLLRWFLEQGANPNIRSVRRGSCAPKMKPLSRAAYAKGTTGLKILLEYGTAMDPEAIFYAIDRHAQGTIAHMQILLDHGANINHWTRRWGTPLHFAVHCDREEKLKFLLENGADPTIRCLCDQTPAESALERGRTKLYEILTEATASRMNLQYGCSDTPRQ